MKNRFANIPWPRILAEGLAIVVGILLAFAIDAWWDRRSERAQAEALAAGLLADFRASQAHAERWLAGNTKILKTLNAFLAALKAAPDDGQVSAPAEWVIAAIGAPTYSPTDATLQAAISSGQIELIDDPDLRNLLALWRQQIDDTREDELLIREIAVHQLVPTLSDQVRLGAAYDFDIQVGWFLQQDFQAPDTRYTIRPLPRLEGALAERVFFTNFVVGGLSDISNTQAEILRLLEQSVGER